MEVQMIEMGGIPGKKWLAVGNSWMGVAELLSRVQNGKNRRGSVPFSRAPQVVAWAKNVRHRAVSSAIVHAGCE